ncbi:hypothetical protein MANES_12G088990v8 [Manihot esculenta]|uniref:Uncharacterized protein n=1 Tax=Manihot esculenta TaxID=3983 RepID=A0ACB7GS09_MANES|nr:hypothetical protein MANES_12G088990v8 [Manihot esculenta]
MATNKERIENLEVGLGQLQDNLQVRVNQDESRDGGWSFYSAKLAKLEFPNYSGDDPTEWFARVDQFFDYQGTPDSEKVSLASYHLRGEANEWWQWLRRTHTAAGTIVTWEIFSEELWSRFGPTDCEDFDESLSKIRQTGLLRDYQREFERLGNRVKGWTQKALMGTFMGGLKTEIAEGIRMFKPKTLKKAISLARMKDEQLLRQKKAIRPSFQTSYSSPTKNKSSTSVKRLSWDEMQTRRAKGLCFNCDEKFVPGRRCAKPQLLILDGGFDIDEDDDEGEPEISLHALTGWSSSVAESLKLLAEPTRPFNVKVANGDPLQCSGKFRNTPALLQGIPFSITFYSLPLMGLDVVLGVQWLRQLGTVQCNWDILSLILQEFHDSPCGGHSGVLRTYKRIASHFFWPSMRKQIQEYVAACSLHVSSSYHPETDGQSKVTNRCLEQTIGMSPFLALYGRHPPMVPRDVEFQVNDHVYLKLQPYRQQSVSRRSS